jgi:hypothetical protein
LGNCLNNSTSLTPVLLYEATKWAECYSRFMSLLHSPEKVLKRGITYPLGYSSKSYIVGYGYPQFLAVGIAYPPQAICICWAIIAWISFRDSPVGSCSTFTALCGWRLELTCCFPLWLLLVLWTPSWQELPALFKK